MKSINRAKYELANAGMWFAEDPKRVGLTTFAVSLIITLVAVIAGVSPAELTVAGPVPGGSGGPGMG